MNYLRLIFFVMLGVEEYILKINIPYLFVLLCSLQ